jgi:tetratricopeptide (TPR) repeat protein
VLREVAAGNPVVILQDTGDGLFFTSWHYAVIYGFDYPSGTLYLRSGSKKQQEMPFTAFEREWMKSGYWAMVVTPPNRIAATATEQGWMQAVLAMDRVADAPSATQAYATALERWPDNVAAAIGLANRYHDSGLMGRAVTVLRGALQRHPQSIIVMNNLAQTLSDEGQDAEALAQVEKAEKAAAETNSPFAQEVRATRQQISQRIAQRKSAARR